MDRIETIVKSLQKDHSDLESTEFELVFSFPSEKMAKEYSGELSEFDKDW